MIILRNYKEREVYMFLSYPEMIKYLERKGIYKDISSATEEDELWEIYGIDFEEIYEGEEISEYLKVDWGRM